MDNQEKEKARKNMDRSMTFRMIAGALLLYIVYEMIRDGNITNATGWEKVLMILAAVAFAVFGVLFIYQGVKYKRGQTEETEAPETEERQQAKPEEPKEIKSSENEPDYLEQLDRLEDLEDPEDEDK